MRSDVQSRRTPPARMARRARSPPGIGVTAAPGVAFNYRYGFRLPAERVGEVQEQHAQPARKSASTAAGSPACSTGWSTSRTSRRCSPSSSIRRSPASSASTASTTVDRADGHADRERDHRRGCRQRDRRRDPDSRPSSRRICARSRRSLPVPDLRPPSAPSFRPRRSSCANRSAPPGRPGPSGRRSLARTPVVFRYGSGDLAPGFGPTVRRSARRFARVRRQSRATPSRLMIVVLILLGLALARPLGLVGGEPRLRARAGRAGPETALHAPVDD